MSNNKNIIAFHLYNDYSGSPKVLTSVLSGLARNGINVKLLTSKSGILDTIANNKNISIKYIPYKFHAESKIKTALNFVIANIRYFLYLLFYHQSSKPVVYINTIMPIGAALGAKLKRFKLIYHYHENAYVKGCFYRILTKLMEKIADKIICVSNTQADCLNRKDNIFVVPNGLNSDFLSQLSPDPERAYNRRNILMLSSLKGFKGVNEFCELAGMMQDFKFTLVLNDTKENCDEFKKSNHCDSIPNLKIYSRSNDVAHFYNDASIILNLSDKRQFIETFGLTVIEGMAAGLPAIAPSAGGPTELVIDGKNGFLEDVEHLDLIKQRLEFIFSSFEIYSEMSRNAINSVTDFTELAMVEKIEEII